MKRILVLILVVISFELFSQNTYPYPSTGDIGIGISSPNNSRFEVYGNPTGGTNFRATGGNARLLVDYNSLGYNYYDAGSHIFRDFAGTTKFVIDGTSGNVGIGTNAPQEKLQISNTFFFHNGGHKVIGFLYKPNGGIDMDSTLYASEIRLDPSNGNLRIGTSSSKTDGPSTKMTINSSGNVGIGTITPSYKLQVHGSLGLGSNLIASGLSFGSDLTVVQHNNTSFAATIANGGGNGLGLDIRAGGNSVASVPLRLARYNDSELFKVNGLGQVSIGEKAVPVGFKLAVDGKAYFEKVVVRNSDNWPDYVFEKSYQLPTLKEVEHHINNKGYLMDMPSAKEVEGNGQDLSEINKLLLKKIEELTLYVIDISKKNEEQDILIKKLLEK